MLVIGVAVALLGTSGDAQMIATRDLTTGSRIPAEHVPPPASASCDQVHQSISNGAVTPAVKADSTANGLQVQIVETSPAVLNIGDEFTATVRLKNAGTDVIAIPSVSDGERVAHTSADGAQEKYEVGDVTFALKSGKDRRVAAFLSSEGALFASPDDKNTYLPLPPGGWVELKLKAKVECGMQDCLSKIEPDEHAVLSAWWYQRVLTHSVTGCNEDHGSSTVKQANSAPFEVVVHGSQPRTPTAPKKLKNHATTHLS